MKANRIAIALAITAVLISTLAVIGFLQTRDIPSGTGKVTLEITSFGSTETNTYDFTNLTALQLLEEHNSVNVTNSKFGAFVNCINSVCSGNNFYWIYYINGKSADVGAGSYWVKNDDSIEFMYEKS